MFRRTRAAALIFGIVSTNTMTVPVIAQETTNAFGGLTQLMEHQVFVRENLEASGVIEGSTKIGNDLQGVVAKFGSGLGSNETAILVQGNITGGAKTVQPGTNVVLGGDVTSRVNLDGGGVVIRYPSLNFETDFSNLQDLSECLRTLPSSGELILHEQSGQSGSAHLMAYPDESGVAVINITDDSHFFENLRGWNIEITANEAEAILINVDVDAFRFVYGDFIGSSASDEISAKLLWNFHSANSLTLREQWEGSILAPLAQVEHFSDIDGGVYAESLSSQANIRLPLFSGSMAIQAELESVGLDCL